MKAKKRYLNMKTVYTIETVDQLTSVDFKSYADFNKECKRLRNEYRIAYRENIYISQRCANNWHESVL